MKPPRYLLREAVVKDFLGQVPPGRFLEYGYGAGHMLVTLSQMGFQGDGYDISDEARREAGRLLQKSAVTNVRLLDAINPSARYDYIFFFELIGYWQDPQAELKKLAGLLNSGGKMVFSFTNKRSMGAAEKYTGEMQCYSREEIVNMLATIPELKLVFCRNYGYPLANIMKPVLNGYHWLRHKLNAGGQDKDAGMRKSGLAERQAVIAVLGLILNRVTILPFAWMQSWFSGSDLGSGYVVGAAKLDQ